MLLDVSRVVAARSCELARVDVARIDQGLADLESCNTRFDLMFIGIWGRVDRSMDLYLDRWIDRVVAC